MIRFLKIARGSLMELDTQLVICSELGLLDDDQLPQTLLRQLYGQLNRLITFRETQDHGLTLFPSSPLPLNAKRRGNPGVLSIQQRWPKPEPYLIFASL